ncbi:MarR family transcriptional regulator [uncultured Oxalicibacterium sp.]|uniref:MarR family winged helix-turn-helix transcriptional regulator n=1 Tax=uncultured Oxalicibacterium sp. TaxID=1168540 RepID=UPI0025FF1A71|nr:MarR family transcriptional regulator [uncultured Oxalicibacterium sp.]
MSDLQKMFPSGTWCLEESVGYLLARCRTKLAKAIDAELTVRHDITQAQGSVLMMLSTGRYATAADLVRDLFIDSASMTRMLDRLEKRALIVRMPSATDRRVFNLQLSEAGAALAEQLRPLYNEVLVKYFASFSKDEVDTLKHLLRKLLDTDVLPADQTGAASESEM